MNLETVYVTVGTTKFDSLIEAVTSDRVLDILKSKGCSKLILQLGCGQRVDPRRIRDAYEIEVEQYEFKFESVRTDIINSDLVIGHAGAGTCMDILSYKKPGLVVINSELMNNHQMELAEQLASEVYLYFCSVEEIAEKLEILNFNALKPYEEDTEAMLNFVEHLNGMMRNA